MRNHIARALEKPSRPNCVAGYCYDCMGGHAEDNISLSSITQRVRECDDVHCPLHAVREGADVRGRRHLSAAIKAKCLECVGGGADPAPQRLVRECECSDCPLHPVRPYVDRSAA